MLCNLGKADHKSKVKPSLVRAKPRAEITNKTILNCLKKRLHQAKGRWVEEFQEYHGHIKLQREYGQMKSHSP